MAREVEGGRNSMNVAGDALGPAVILSTADSIFPAILAVAWQKRGLKVTVVSCGERGRWLPADVPVIRSGELQPPVLRWGWRAARPLVLPCERLLARLWRRRFRRVTGKPAPDPWEWQVVQPSLTAKSLASAVASLRPRFVFGQEAAAYGLATALCRGIPRILFPWGSDVFNTAESWPAAYWMIRHALRSVDLVTPSSTTAAQHLIDRFGLPESKVKAVSWGIELAESTRATPTERARICAKWGIDRGAVIVQNCRRFMPHWGCFTALDAFLRLAADEEGAHFVLLGGRGTQELMSEARRRVEAAGRSAQFTLIDRELKIDEFHELAAISDIFVSLVPRGDMRSSSVLQLAAAGAAPVIGDVAEYRLMAELGFSALFPQADNVEQVVEAVRRYLRLPELRAETAQRNAAYLHAHEDRETQMDALLALIDDVCRRYYGPSLRDSEPSSSIAHES